MRFTSTQAGPGEWIPALNPALHAHTAGDKRFRHLIIYILAFPTALLFCDRSLCPARRRILIWSDSMNTVDASHSLSSDTTEALRILQT